LKELDMDNVYYSKRKDKQKAVGEPQTSKDSLKPLSRSMEPPLPSQHPHRSSFHGSGSMKPKGKQEWDSKEQVKRYSSGKVPPMSHIPRNGNSIEDDLGEAAYRAKKASEERIIISRASLYLNPQSCRKKRLMRELSFGEK